MSVVADPRSRPALTKRLLLMRIFVRAQTSDEKRCPRDALEIAIWPSVMDETIRPFLYNAYAPIKETLILAKIIF